MKKNWIVELVSEEVVLNIIEIEAENIEKVDYHNLLVDGISWSVPEKLGMSFAEIRPAN